MAWTYKLEELKDKKLYQVRYTIGDVDENDPLLQDEEINFELEMAKDDVLTAAISCCEKIAARFAKKVKFTLGPHSVDMAERAREYKVLAEELRKKKLRYSAMPLATLPKSHVFDIGMMNTTF